MMFSLVNPKPKTVQDADGEQDGASQQEPPQALREASKDVCEPRCNAGKSK
jgi:hypothetical protein